MLAAVGDRLQAEGDRVGIVVVGGASLNLLGLIERTTSDVEAIARVRLSDDRPEQALVPPEPMPEPLVGAVETVARALPFEVLDDVLVEVNVNALRADVRHDELGRAEPLCVQEFGVGEVQMES